MNIVTISRQVGSYGDVIAAIVARRMGLQLFSRAQVHELAQSCDREYRDVCEVYETEHGPGFFDRIFFDRPAYTSLFEALTYETASQGNVVIVGRGSQIILRDVPGVFKARIFAPLETRVQRIKERYGFSEERSRSFVRKYDQERRNLVVSVFDKDPSEWTLYDLMINTEHFSSGDAAEVVIKGAEVYEKASDKEQVLEHLKNMALAKRVETVVRKRLTSAVASHVEVSAESGGVIKIFGRIADKRHKEQATKVAAAYPGVTKVENDLKLTELTFGL